jgi:hypothetical protein
MGGQIEQSQREVRDAKASGSVPLKNPKFEKLSREFAAESRQADAWRAVYGRDPSTGNPSRTFARPEIIARIEFLRAEFTRQAGVSLAALQVRLLRIADASVTDLLERVRPQEGKESAAGSTLRLRDITKLPANATAAISELEIDGDGVRLKTTKTTDRLHAIDSLLKTIGGFQPEDADRRGSTLEDLILAARKGGGSAVQLNVVTGVPRRPDDPPPRTIHGMSAPASERNSGELGVRRVRLNQLPIRDTV